MSSTVAPFAHGVTPPDFARPLPDQAGDRGGRMPGGGDLAWQRAMEQARRAEFDAWFGKAQPLPSAAFSAIGSGAGVTSWQADRLAVARAGETGSPPQPVDKELLPAEPRTWKTSTSAAVSTGTDAGDAALVGIHSTTDMPATPRIESVRRFAQESVAVMQARLDQLVDRFSREFAANGVAATPTELALLGSPFASAEQPEAPSPLQGTNPIGWLGTVVRSDEADAFDARPTDENAAPEADAANGTAPPAPRDPEAATPIRIYAEWTDSGVKVWLGSDAQALLELEPLAMQLQRWMQAHGERLIGLVCNGRVQPLPTSGDYAHTTDQERTAIPFSKSFTPGSRKGFALPINPYPPESP